MCKKALFLTALFFVAINSFSYASPLPRGQMTTRQRSFLSRGGSVLTVDSEKSSNNTSSTVNNSTLFAFTEQPITSSEKAGTDLPANNKALKVLFLSADTGGGHRASAESLANQVSSQSWGYPNAKVNNSWKPLFDS